MVWRGWYAVDGMSSKVLADLAQQDRQTTVAEDIDLGGVGATRASVEGVIGPVRWWSDPAGGVNSEHSVQMLQQWMRDAVDKDSNINRQKRRKL